MRETETQNRHETGAYGADLRAICQRFQRRQQCCPHEMAFVALQNEYLV